MWDSGLGRTGVSWLRDCSSGSSSQSDHQSSCHAKDGSLSSQTLPFVPKSVSLTLSLNTLLTGPSVSGTRSSSEDGESGR